MSEERAGSFRHGVASGDPTTQAVTLWTRVSPPDPTRPANVAWKLFAGPDLEEVTARGTTTTSPRRDFTVHVRVEGLPPGRHWWYRFETGSEVSTVGRTRTVPEEGPLRIGLVSCSSLADGHFAAYARVAERDVDLVVHVGDFLYELPGGGGDRQHQPDRHLSSLGDYRTRHAQYRGDPALRRLLARHPVAAVWDDHDCAGNAWHGGAASHNDDRNGPWPRRKAAAQQAWTEWLPVHLPAQGDPSRIWRHLPLGRTADLLLLDTRLDGRDRQLTGDEPDAELQLGDPARSLLSADQRRWLEECLAASGARWQVLANQVVLTPLVLDGVPAPVRPLVGFVAPVFGDRALNPDQWDGYPAERQRLLDAARRHGARLVVLTGDVHSSWAAEVRHPDGGLAGVELVTPAVSAPSFASIVGPGALEAPDATATALCNRNPHFRWGEIRSHGYTVVELSDEAVQAEWWHLRDVHDPDSDERLAASWRWSGGDEGLVPGASPVTR